MDKYAALANLFSPTASSGSSELDKLFGLRPITDEERESWRKADEEERRALLGGDQSVEPSQGRIPQLSGNVKKRAEALAPIIRAASEKHGVPFDLLMGMTHVESKFDPSATSGAGAEGTAQFMPATAKQYRLTNTRDPVASADAQARYMRDLLDMFGGDETKAIAAYNAGQGTIQRAKSIPNMGYVDSVRAARTLYSGQDQPIQAGAGSPAEQLLPPDQAQPEQPDLSNLDLVTLTDGSQAYFRKDMPMEERVKRLQADGVSALPTRPFTAPSGENVLVRFNMSDDEALAKIGAQTPELMQRPRGLPEEDKSGYLAAAKKGLLESLSPIATGLGGEAQRLGEYLGPESTIGQYATEAGTAMREYGAEAGKRAEKAFQMPKDASALEKNFLYPLVEGGAQIIPYGAAYAIPGVGLGLGTVAGTTALYGGAMGEAEQKAAEVGKPFVPEEARPWALGDVALNTLGLRMLGPLKNVFGPEAVEAPQAFVRGLIEKEGVEGAKAKMGSMVTDVLKGMGVTGGVNVANEVAEDMLYRGYAGQDLFNEDALQSYLSTAKQAAPIGVSMGAVHGAAKRSAKVEELTRAEEQAGQQEQLQQQFLTRMEEAGTDVEKLSAYRDRELAALSEKPQEEITPEDQDRLATLQSSDAYGVLQDYVASQDRAKEAEIAAKQAEIPEELRGLSQEDRAAVEQARTQQEKYYAPLGLPERGGNVRFLRKRLDSLDINNPEHAEAINDALNRVEESGQPYNKPGMELVRAKIEEVKNAEQIPSASALDGRSSAQPEIREEGRDQVISGEGMEPSRQRVQAPEISREEVQVAQAPEVEVAQAQPAPQVETEETRAAPSEEDHQTALNEVLKSGLTATAKKGNLGSSLGAMVKENVRNGILTPFQAAVFDERAPIQHALKNLGSNVGDKLRGDFAYSAHSQRGNVIQQGIKKGFLKMDRDGTLSVVENERLAPERIYERIRDQHAKTEGHTPEQADKIVSEMLVRLRSKTIREQDAATRAEAANLMDRASELDAHVATLPTKTQRDKFVKAANNLRRIAQEKYDSIGAKLDEYGNVVEEGGRTIVTDKQVREGLQLMDKYKNTYGKEVQNIHELLRTVPSLMRDSGMINAKQAKDYQDYANYFPFYNKEYYDQHMSDPLKEEHMQPYLNGMGSRSPKTVPEIKRQEAHAHEIYTADNLLRHLMYWASAASEHSARRNTCEQLAMVGAAERLKEEPSDKNFVVKVKENGKDVFYKVRDPNVYYAFQAAAPIVNPVVRALKSVAGFQRNLFVVNPLFWYRQLIREPKQASRLAKVGIITPVDVMAEAARIAAGKSVGYERLSAKGAIGPVDATMDPAKRVESLLKGQGFAKKSWEKIYFIHEAMDAATRAVVYDRAFKKYTKRGLDADTADALAVKDARELMNFARNGRNENLRSLRAITPFLGSWFNSIDVLLKALSPEKYAGLSKSEAMEARRTFMGTSSAMILMGMAYSLAMSDDEEWVNNRDRNGNMLLRNPFPNKDVQPFISLPLEFEIGWLQHTLPENMLLANIGAISETAKKENIKEGAEKLLMFPSGFFNVFNGAVRYMMNLEESKTHPGAGAGMYGRGLEAFQDDKSSELAKELAAKLREMKVEVSPDELEKDARSLLGGMWAVAASASNELMAEKVGGAATPEKALTERLPFVPGAFSGQHKDAAVRDAYNVISDIDKVQTTLSRIKNTKNLMDLNKFMLSPEYIQAAKADKALNGLATSMKEISTQIATVTASESTAHDKRVLNDQLEDKREQIAKEILRRAKMLGVYE